MVFQPLADKVYAQAVRTYDFRENRTGPHGHHPIEPKYPLARVQQRFAWVKTAFANLDQHTLASASAAGDAAAAMQSIGGAGETVIHDVASGDGSEATISGTLGTAAIQDISDGVEGWSGKTAVAFRGFYGKVPWVVANQVGVARILGAGMNFNAALCASVNRDVALIANHTITALDAYATDGPETAVNLSAVSAVCFLASAAIGLGAAAFTGGASIAGAIATMGATLSLTGAASNALNVAANPKPTAGTQPLKISGYNTDSILNSMVAAVNNVSFHVDTAESQVAQTLNRLSADIDMDKDGYRAGAGYRYVAPRPSQITDDPAAAHRRFTPPPQYRR